MSPGPNLQKQFDDSVKEEIRSAINIADVVGRHVALKATGQNLKGLCPFHKEKTPSFTVSPAKGIYYCFGCHKGGDVFNFLMELEGLTFPEALQLLADEAGIKLAPRETRACARPSPGEEPARGSPPRTSCSPSTISRSISFTSDARTFHWPSTILSRADCQKRPSATSGSGTRRTAGPHSWISQKVRASADTRSCPRRTCNCEAGTGRVYDRFRDRIMFPIFDSSKRPVGFAGRGLTADAMPKYLNSPETPLYQKSKILYGFHVTQQFIRESKSVIIVEGYMDFLVAVPGGREKRNRDRRNGLYRYACANPSPLHAEHLPGLRR